MALSTFRRLWLDLLPYIVVSRPATDLCWTCQRLNNLIWHSANRSDADKTADLQAKLSHIGQVDSERKFYRKCVSECKEGVQRLGLQQLGPNAPCSRDVAAHYSFDYAQQVHIPSHPAQPGPLYFLTPRKCGIFGVCCEGFAQQVNYLIDEGVSISKGSNAVISYLHHFFGKYGLGERSVSLHCDNCAGQNKNRYVLWYFCWRTLCGLHEDVTINFMPPGHTKFAPDWCFGILKRTFRRSEVSCLADMCEVVKQSTPVKHTNIAQLVGHEDGRVEVPSFDWQLYFQRHFKPLVGMKKLGHFRMSSRSPGVLFYRETLADEEQQFQMCPQPDVTRAALQGNPQAVQLPGLSLERRRYLYQTIREFVREDVRDIVAPNPDA